MAKNIWDVFGKRIGSTSKLPDGKRHVYDTNGQPLGNVSSEGTFGLNGNKISRTPDAGLLFKRSKK